MRIEGGGGQLGNLRGVQSVIFNSQRGDNFFAMVGTRLQHQSPGGSLSHQCKCTLGIILPIVYLIVHV